MWVSRGKINLPLRLQLKTTLKGFQWRKEVFNWNEEYILMKTPLTGNSWVILQREETSAWNADNWSPETGPWALPPCSSHTAVRVSNSQSQTSNWASCWQPITFILAEDKTLVKNTYSQVKFTMRTDVVVQVTCKGYHFSQEHVESSNMHNENRSGYPNDLQGLSCI